LFAVLIGCNVAAWIWALAICHGQPALLGTALLASVLGLRYAVDADHIAAIDNTVRKLMQQGQRPVTTGLFFSLGHSTVVIAAVVLLVVTAAAFKDDLANFKSYGSAMGASVSAVFLLLIAALNLIILVSIWRSFRSAARSASTIGIGAICTDLRFVILIRCATCSPRSNLVRWGTATSRRGTSPSS
jgi:high-affinity nickel-transport protein